MSDITLSSKEYCESVFIDGPKFDKLSAFVSGPDAQVQGKLTAGTGISLNGSTISVNTATSVGTSNLPVTASAVNTKLNSYATTTQLNNKQDKLTSANAGDNITITGSGSSLRISTTGGSSFKYISESDDWQTHTSLLLGQGPDGDVANSVFICGPLYVTDLDNYINVNAPIKMCNTEGSWYGTTTIGMQETMISGGLNGFGIKYEGDNGTKTGIWIGSDTLWANACIQIDMYTYDGTRSAELFLDADKLNKLSSLLDNADALLALLKN